MDDQESNFRDLGDFVIKRTDPYGFWHIESKTGKQPAEVVGKSYTNTTDAKKAVKDLMNKRAEKVRSK